MDALVDRFQAVMQSFKRSLEADILHKMDAKITGPQMYMLYYIHQGESCKLTQLAEKMDVKPSAVTVMIDRLERAGYVKRTHDTVDRRSILVEVTQAGKEVLEKAVQDRNEIIRAYLSRIEPEEVRLVTELLEKMMRAESRREKE